MSIELLFQDTRTPQEKREDNEYASLEESRVTEASFQVTEETQKNINVDLQDYKYKLDKLSKSSTRKCISGMVAMVTGTISLITTLEYFLKNPEHSNNTLFYLLTVTSGALALGGILYSLRENNKEIDKVNVRTSIFYRKELKRNKIKDEQISNIQSESENRIFNRNQYRKTQQHSYN